MKTENQLGILRMVAKDFRRFDDYEVMINGTDNEVTMQLSRDFINRVTVSYTADDIIRISNENNGEVFKAILNDFSRINKELTKAKYKSI